MPVSPIEPTTATGYLSGAEAASALSALSPTTAPASTGQVGATAFASVLGGAVDNTQQLQAASNELTIAAVSGDLADIHQATIASTRAATTLELVATVRNKAVDAFNEIMRMQA
ncbi:flagellar hook-basal body complex protein FliE [Oerskovia gallyi]|uniref:Flagellar hook-basal body complex protein FliE n=1 Tax=Oerskovia gallyi TaxID=2762226 RepID=A0ABR8V5K1_9CELL|nr:flagellar hook-basal body complex protein FliE [Oerskovia gallyi]MBD7999932.1 flagellar hook-basal body complex protein FliE [Oerskovia gallyi]